MRHLTTLGLASLPRGVDEAFYRPAEVDLLIGDATKARTKLGWTPKYDLQMMVEEMMASDLDAINLKEQKEHLKMVRRFE